MSIKPSVAVVVGNPKPQSRTLAAATQLAEELTGSEPGLVVDLADLGASLLDWSDPGVATLVEQVGAADMVAVPFMLGAGPGHALAPELTLRPVLTEIGASVPVRGLYVLDSAYDDPAAYDAWLARARPLIDRHLAQRV